MRLLSGDEVLELLRVQDLVLDETAGLRALRCQLSSSWKGFSTYVRVTDNGRDRVDVEVNASAVVLVAPPASQLGRHSQKVSLGKGADPVDSGL